MLEFRMRWKLPQSPEVVLGGKLQIVSVKLIKITAAQGKPPQAAFAGGSQVLWPSVFYPAVGTRPLETALCRDYEVSRIRVKSLGYDLFTHSRAVGVRGVDEINS